MKVLFVGNTRRTALALHYFTNMVRLGYSVLPFDPDFFYARHLLDRVAIKLRRNSPTKNRQKRVAEGLVNLCSKNRFDVVLVMAQNYIARETLDEIRGSSKTPPLLIYHSHDNNFAPGILKPTDFFETLKMYDFVFTTKSKSVERYRQMGQDSAYFLASAFEPSIHHPIANECSIYANKLFDVTFIGTYDQSRTKYLEAVGWNRLHVWGDFWTRFGEYSKHREQINPRAIYDFEFADVTSHSRLALGLLREEADDLHTTRTFEIPACGAAQVAPRNAEILTFFEEDSEIICFDSPEELRDKVQYYIKNDWKRAQIARKGYERCLRDRHTYLDRVNEMFNIVRERTGDSRIAAPLSR